MTTWTVRHAGSSRSVPGLSAGDVVAGLTEGQWESTDEVRGADEPTWRPIEEHPQFAEAAFHVDAPPPARHVDETRLDMNPLIDVALVLLIFFILTTTYETLRKVLDMPGASAKKQDFLPVVTPEKIRDTMIFIQARASGGQAAITVEQTLVPEAELRDYLRRHVRDSKKLIVLIDAAPEVEWDSVAGIMDAARGAGITRSLFLRPPPPGATKSGP